MGGGLVALRFFWSLKKGTDSFSYHELFDIFLFVLFVFVTI